MRPVLAWQFHRLLTFVIHRTVGISLAATLGISLGLASADLLLADEPDAARSAPFTEQARPLLAKYCFGCHGAGNAEADLNLERFGDRDAILEARGPWLKVLAHLRAQAMPPLDNKEVPRPSSAEYESLVQWLDTALNQIDCTGEVNPGRVTLRRLNRNEYRNTIRDLVGIDYQPVDDFPADDVGYGFDNIGDVLSMSPILMEKYLAAAESILDRALVVPSLRLRKLASGEQLQADDGSSRSGNGPRTLASNGTLWLPVELPEAGRYEIRILAAGDQAGPEKVKMAIRVDDQELRVAEVRTQRNRPTMHPATAEIGAGMHRIGAAFLNDYYKPDAENAKERDRNLIVFQLEIRGPLPSSTTDLPETHRRVFIDMPGEESNVAEAAEKILKRFANRAFRRPATAQELKRLVDLTRVAQEEGQTFEGGIHLALQAVLASPHFLFRVEGDPPAREKSRQLNEFEIATRLSYFLWSSLPDEELFQLAWEEKLTKEGELERQVARMIRDPKSRALVDNFASQWLNLRLLDNLNPDPARFPEFVPELRLAMKQETQRFFAEMLAEDRPIREFLTADFTYLNEPLARLYGVPGVAGPDLRKVSLQGTNRRGLLTQASILTLTSNPTRTSPVKRGKWVMENLLGEAPPAPPPNVPELMDGEQAQQKGSLRERMQQHRENPNCAVCHERMDALGFAFENFDPIGKWRDRDGNFPIDSSVTLPGGESLAGWNAMVNWLAEQQREAFVRCFTEKMLTFALGRGLEYYDQCAVDKILKGLSEHDDRLVRLVQLIVASEPFQKRGAAPGNP
ncbi:MAG: DUF1592 domain-containing protein [Planctomycetes bacterium]|nr:DUF1592 domain-containing protein [Planctomycetota bacterium]